MKLVSVSVGASLSTLCGAILAGCGGQALDVGTTAPPAPPATSGASSDALCVAAGTEPMLLAGLGDLSAVKIESDRETLWVNVLSPSDPRPAVYRLPSGGGALDPFLPSARILGLAGEDLAYATSWGVEGDLIGVSLRNRATGQVTPVPLPPGASSIQRAITHRSGVYTMWATESGYAVSRFELATRTTLDLFKQNLSDQTTLSMAVDGQELFVAEDPWKSDLAPRIHAVSVGGGAMRTIERAGSEWLLGADDTELFVVVDQPHTRELTAISKDGRGERVLVHQTPPAPAVVDTTAVYLVGDGGVAPPLDAPRTITRVDKKTGAVDVMAVSTAQRISALAVDACNIYFATSEPAAIWARSK